MKKIEALTFPALHGEDWLEANKQAAKDIICMAPSLPEVFTLTCHRTMVLINGETMVAWHVGVIAGGLSKVENLETQMEKMKGGDLWIPCFSSMPGSPPASSS